MKTLSEHNSRNGLIKKDKYKAEVACDVCGTELQYTSPDLLLLSAPPQKNVKCFECGFIGYKTEYDYDRYF